MHNLASVSSNAIKGKTLYLLATVLTLHPPLVSNQQHPSICDFYTYLLQTSAPKPYFCWMHHRWSAQGTLYCRTELKKKTKKQKVNVALKDWDVTRDERTELFFSWNWVTEHWSVSEAQEDKQDKPKNLPVVVFDVFVSLFYSPPTLSSVWRLISVGAGHTGDPRGNVLETLLGYLVTNTCSLVCHHLLKHCPSFHWE